MTKRISVILKGEEFASFYAIVDDSDFEHLNLYKWWIDKRTNAYNDTFYAKATIAGHDVLMHKFLTGFDRTDHANRNGLDNRRVNLRDCTQSQNQANSKPTISYGGKPTSSKFKGVKRCASTGRWMVAVTKDRKSHWVGRFDNEIDAALAYDAKAKELFGEFARTNF